MIQKKTKETVSEYIRVYKNEKCLTLLQGTFLRLYNDVKLYFRDRDGNRTHI